MIGLLSGGVKWFGIGAGLSALLVGAALGFVVFGLKGELRQARRAFAELTQQHAVQTVELGTARLNAADAQAELRKLGEDVQTLKRASAEAQARASAARDRAARAEAARENAVEAAAKALEARGDGCQTPQEVVEAWGSL